MTIIEKNIAIAEMLGFKKGFWYSVEKPVTDDKKQFCDFEGQDKVWKTSAYPKENLLFHSDANWQFEAIDWIENLHEGIAYNVRIESNKCEISVSTQYALAYDEHLSIFQFGSTKKEAIFEALFQFSQYLKQNK